MSELAVKTLSDLVAEQPDKEKHGATTQCGRILKALKTRGSVTNVQLNNQFHIFRYSARIKDLRDEGYRIESVHVDDGLWEFRYHGHEDDPE